ncbi:MAG: flagellar hook-length control protein FliK [Treponema sp.]|nr:flagellar hook-length control protein FliK [Treponema sp.]
MIITAYPESVPVEPPVNENIRKQEEERNDDHPPFAEILAGLTRPVQENQTETETASDALSLESMNAEIDLDLLIRINNNGVEKDSVIDFDDINIPDMEISGIDFSGDGLSNIDLSDIDLPEEFINILNDPENQLIRDLETSISEDGGSAKAQNAKLAAAPADNSADAAARISANASVNVSANLPEETIAAGATAEQAQTESEHNVVSGLTNHSNNDDSPAHEQRGQNFNNRGNSGSDANRSNEENVIAHNKPGRLDEMRGRSRHERLSFEIRDQRSSAAGAAAGTANTTGVNTHGFTSVEASVNRMTADSSLHEITLDLRLPDYNPGSTGQAAQTVWEARAANTGSASVLENMLARELHQSFNGDIVRHASMALRDGGEGTIRLALRPESLGNVKIHLELTDNKITGHIFVDSQEALNAFRREVASLEQAFMESGYTDANLDLSLTQDGGREWQEMEESYASRNAASEYENSLREITDDEMETLVEAFFGRRSGLINLHA